MQNPWLGTLYIIPVLIFFEYVAYFISYALINFIGWVAELCFKYLVKSENVKNDNPQQERDIELANVIARAMVIFSMSPILTILALNRLDTIVLEVAFCFAIFATFILLATGVKSAVFSLRKYLRG